MRSLILQLALLYELCGCSDGDGTNRSAISRIGLLDTGPPLVVTKYVHPLYIYRLPFIQSIIDFFKFRLSPPSFYPESGTYYDYSMEIISSCAPEDQGAQIHYTFGEGDTPEPGSKFVICGENIRITGTGKVIFRAFSSAEGRYPSDMVQMDYTVIKTPYESFPVGVLDFEVLPRFEVHVVEKSLSSSYPQLCSQRNIRGRLVILENPIGHFNILPPRDGCGNLAQPSHTADGMNIDYYSLLNITSRYDAETYYRSNITNWRAKQQEFDEVAGSNCLLVTNAGFFNITDHDCIGNIISMGNTVHRSTKKNANFGIRQGKFYTGYFDVDSPKEPFDTLISGLGWLVRKGVSYITESLHEDEEGKSVVQIDFPLLSIQS